jgi:hypothetical protein
MIFERVTKALVGNERIPQADRFASLLEGVLQKGHGYTLSHWKRADTDELVRRIYLAHYNGITDLRDERLGDGHTCESPRVGLDQPNFPGLGDERAAEMRDVQELVFANFHIHPATAVDDYLGRIPRWFLAEIMDDRP